jgi:hypothetical protein
MRSQLEKAINLASRTGDKIIVVDELNDRSFAVMNFADYEKLVKGQSKGNRSIAGLTEEELLDKINHDIVSWKKANADNDFSSGIPGFDNDWEDDDEDFKPHFATDDDEENNFVEDNNFDEEDEMEDTDIFPDFTAPNFNTEGNIIPEMEEEELEENNGKIVDESASVNAAPDENENMYYYSEPGKSEIEKEEGGFTSIKDELKNKKHWEIPKEAKKAAEDIRF